MNKNINDTNDIDITDIVITLIKHKLKFYFLISISLIAGIYILITSPAVYSVDFKIVTNSNIIEDNNIIRTAVFSSLMDQSIVNEKHVLPKLTINERNNKLSYSTKDPNILDNINNMLEQATEMEIKRWQEYAGLSLVEVLSREESISLNLNIGKIYEINEALSNAKTREFKTVSAKAIFSDVKKSYNYKPLILYFLLSLILSILWMLTHILRDSIRSRKI